MMHHSGAKRAAGMLCHIPSAVMARLDRAIQYSRGVSAQSLLPLEYWIVRSRLRQGSGAASHSQARRSFSGGKPDDDTELLFDIRIGKLRGANPSSLSLRSASPDTLRSSVSAWPCHA
jgi:hypothetical protein